jgi:uncharacterized SAM-binding protein YcdF (DUF218 family)
VDLHRNTGLPLIFTGAATASTNKSEAAAMLEACRSEVEGAEVYLEENARNTVENAIYCLKYALAAEHKLVHLVTSDFHLPRAAAIFRHVLRPYGISVVGYASTTQYSLCVNDEEAPTVSDVIKSEVRSLSGLNAYFQKYGLEEIDSSVVQQLITDVEDFERNYYFTGK